MSQTSRSEEKTIRFTLILYAGIIAAKFAAYFITGVMGLLAEALHTLSDIIVSGFLLIALWWSRQREDKDHQFGHGRAQYVGALVAATLFLSFTALRLVEEAVPRLFSRHETAFSNLPVALGVLIGSLAVGCIPLGRLFFQKNKGAAAHAQFMELVNDQLGILAALAGTTFIMLGYPLADPIASLVVAAIIAVNAVGLFRENLSYLLGRSPGAEFLAKAKATALAVPGVREVHLLRGQMVGPGEVHLELHFKVDRGMTIEAADKIAEEVHRRIHQETSCRYCSIHVDPA
jgi:cation diffusion facilitator family transporter